MVNHDACWHVDTAMENQQKQSHMLGRGGGGGGGGEEEEGLEAPTSDFSAYW